MGRCSRSAQLIVRKAWPSEDHPIFSAYLISSVFYITDGAITLSRLSSPSFSTFPTCLFALVTFPICPFARATFPARLFAHVTFPATIGCFNSDMLNRNLSKKKVLSLCLAICTYMSSNSSKLNGKGSKWPWQKIGSLHYFAVCLVISSFSLMRWNQLTIHRPPMSY